MLQTVVVRANLGEGEPKDKGEAKEKEQVSGRVAVGRWRRWEG